MDKSYIDKQPCGRIQRVHIQSLKNNPFKVKVSVQTYNKDGYYEAGLSWTDILPKNDIEKQLEFDQLERTS